MPGDRAETLVKLVSRYAAAAKDYSNYICGLSDVIVAVERVLRSLPGKIEASVKIDNALVLSFDRGGADWSLYLEGCEEFPCLLRDAPIDQKIKAYPYLEVLIESMLDTQAKRLLSLQAALPNVTSVRERIRALKASFVPPPPPRKEVTDDVPF